MFGISSAELWIVASTVIFIAVVWKPAGRAIAGALDSRRDTIVRELEEARRLRAEAEALLKEATEKHKNAARDATAIVDFARQESERLRMEGETALKNSLARRERQALDRIAQAEAGAVSEVKSRAIDLALSAAATLLTEKLSGADGDAVIDRALEDMPGELRSVG